MKKLIFVFVMILTLGLIACGNGSCGVESLCDSVDSITVLDSMVDSLSMDTVLC